MPRTRWSIPLALLTACPLVPGETIEPDCALALTETATPDAKAPCTYWVGILPGLELETLTISAAAANDDGMPGSLDLLVDGGAVLHTSLDPTGADPSVVVIEEGGPGQPWAIEWSPGQLRIEEGHWKIEVNANGGLCDDTDALELGFTLGALPDGCEGR